MDELGEDSALGSVLIADGDAEQREISRRTLAGSLFGGRLVEVLTAGSLASARRVLDSHPGIAVVLLDANLGGPKRGLELVSDIRALNRSARARIVVVESKIAAASVSELFEQHEVNDLRTREELSGDELYACVAVALRAHAEVVALEQARRDLALAAKARADAEAANAAKTIFLATMSHEIRTPMNGVLGMVELLSQSRLDLDQQRIVELVQDSATTLLKIIDDILDFSKIEAGRVELEAAAFSPLALAESLVATFAPQAMRKHTTLITIVDPALPEQVFGDAIRLRQVLYNLVGNAIKFTEQGEVILRLNAAEAPTGRTGITFSVSDSGVGMTPEQIRGLFQPFMQADLSTTRRYGGTGLGLSISQRLIQLMGGVIEATSEEGIGSVFHFTLDFESDPDSPAVTEKALKGCRLLVIEESATKLDQLVRYCEAAGAEVFVAMNAVSALTAVERAPRPFDITLITARMPDRDAASLAQELLETLPGKVGRLALLVPGSMSSRYGSYPPAPFDMILQRPLRRHELIARLAELAAGRTERRSDLADEAGLVGAGELASAARILVVEDNAINREVIARQLDHLGLRYDLADDGLAGLARVRREEFDLVLTDLRMPELDGHGLAKAVRALEKAEGRTRLPIIAITANATIEEADACRRAGMDDFLGKPVQLAKLKETLARWLPLVPGRPDAPISSHGLERDVVDLAHLEAMIGNDLELRKLMLNRFVGSAAISAAELCRLLQDGVISVALETAHSLKGAARSAGAMAMGDLAEELERACRKDDLPGARALAARLVPAVAKVERFVERL